jgi:hypothetical protein
MGLDKKSPAEQEAMKKGMAMMYVWQFVASLVMFTILAYFIANYYKPGIAGGVHVAFWAWLGFMVTQKFGDSLWGGKMTLFWLSIGSSFLTLIIGGIIIGVLR